MENENNNVRQEQETTYHYDKNETPFGREDVSGRPEAEKSMESSTAAEGQGVKAQNEVLQGEVVQSKVVQNEAFRKDESTSQSGMVSGGMQQNTDRPQQTAASSYTSGNPYSQGSVYGQGIYTGSQFAAQQPVTENKRKKTRKPSGGKTGKVVRFVASAAAFGLIAGGVMVGVNAIGNKALGNQGVSKNTEIAAVVTSGGTKSTSSNSSVADMAEEVMPSIVSITNTSVQTVRSWFQSYEQEVSGSGSGIIIGQDDDEIMIVTNNHVIEGAKELTVAFCDQTAVEATVKGADSIMDLAVLTVKTKDVDEATLKQIKVAAMGSSDELRVGDAVFAIGNALGSGQSLTGGYISALNREVDMEDKTMTLLQTDAAINPGNSGGALLNEKGEVIGINTVKYVDDTVEGMGYAIPITVAIPIINDLMNQEVIAENEQGYLGIQGNTITDTYAEDFNMPKGIYVVKIVENSPADQCGLKAGDIITGFAGRDVTSMENLQSILANKKVGDEVEMTVQRNNEKGEYEEKQLTVTLGAKKDMPASESGEKSSRRSQESQIPEEDQQGGQFISPEEFFEYFGN